ncbi:MAG: alpha/beta fold hydrolase [Planctomycetota bacterium]|nr:alpha/beta fold hydrolase [Planctomycetota bacterium]
MILHGTGLDYRWGMSNNPVAVFRPDDIVISVDGTGPGQGDSRLFLGEKKDAEGFRDFLAEIRKHFKVDQVFLYGHSQGGFFVTFYSGLFPETVAGVVAHASGTWTWTETGKRAQKVAVALLHGSGDPVVPYRQSPGAYAALEEAGFDRLLLRRMPGYNHWPNAVRATECLDWCEGMLTADPDRALSLAVEMMRPKGADEYQYEIPPAFAAARMVLRRFQGEGPDPFGGVPSTLQDRASELISALDKLTTDIVKDFEKEIGKKLDLGKEPPLAGLLAFRADFRGIEPAERWFQKIGFDKAEKAHAKAAGAIFDAWYAEKKSDGDRYTEIVAALKDAWLYDGYPLELGERLTEWKGLAKSLDLDKKALKANDDVVEPWLKGWEARVWERYSQACSKWKVPK